MTPRRLRSRLRGRKLVYRLQRALLRTIEPRVTGTLQIALRRQLAEHRERLARGAVLPSLEDAEFKVFSQGGEDGILLYLLALTGWERKRFLEIGIQDGWECNCANLAKHLGWDGWFVEADPAGVALARQQFGWDPGASRRAVQVIEALVTRESAPRLVAEHGIAELDLLSIDIDSMDWWVWRALGREAGLRPRVVAIEYNAAYGPERALTVPYQDAFDRWRAHPSGLYYGASLAALERLGRELGYRLAGCDSNGVNAFFVRDDAAPAPLRGLSTAEAFRQNSYQNHGVPYARQWETIAHLLFESV